MPEREIVLLGLGMQGRAALYDLFNNCSAQITVADCNPGLNAELSRYPSDRVTGRVLDVKDESAVISLIRDADLVVEALPAVYALPVGRAAAGLGVNLVSSMFYLDPGKHDGAESDTSLKELEEVDRDARRNGAAILTEFGLDPGLDLILGKQALDELDHTEEFYSYGAGLPFDEATANPLEYKFSWSVIGVMRAYRRPARLISNGKIVEIDGREIFDRENRHLLELDDLDTPLECYPNGDCVPYAELFGIRDSVREMGRYTCRWPGHCNFWERMTKSGFLDEAPLQVGDVAVPPVEFTASLLGSQAQFHYAGHEQDLAMIRVDTRGTLAGKKIRLIYQVLDYRDLETGFTAMQRTVGFTMGIGARLILDGKLKKHGLLTPLDVPLSLIRPKLESYGIRITREELPFT